MTNTTRAVFLCYVKLHNYTVQLTFRCVNYFLCYLIRNDPTGERTGALTMAFQFTATLTLLACIIFTSAISRSYADAGDSGTCSAPPPADQVHGFAVFEVRPEDEAAFVQDLRPLIEATREEPGNVYYNMFTNPTKPGAIGFTESYKDFPALQAHLQSKHVADIFQHEYYRTLVTGRQLFGPWKEVQPPGCDNEEEIEMVFYWNVNCTAKHVWNIITNWTDASWIAGRPTATIVPLRDDGTVMSDEEAKEKGDVDIKGGLGPVVQRRTWPSGYSLDVRMLKRDDTNFVTVQQTMSELVFPNVTFDKFFVTISLHTDGLDADIETRIRYHTRATVKRGTNEQARLTLKNDFYGPRIEFYQKIWNCTTGVNMKTAQKGLAALYGSFKDEKRADLVANAFADPEHGKKYLQRTLGAGPLPNDVQIKIATPIPPVVTPDLEAVAVEDVVMRSLSGTVARARIVRYQLDAWGRIVSARVYDTPSAACNQFGIGSSSSGSGKKKQAWWSRLMGTIASAEQPCQGAEFVDATERYFNTLQGRDIEAVRSLFSDNPTLIDPAGFVPPRTFDSVYTNFYRISKSFVYNRYPTRSFVDPESRQTVQLIDARFELADSGAEFKATPVQFFTFDNSLRIEKFEAYFTPRLIDFSALE